MGISIIATLLVSFYEYYKYKESLLIFLVPCIIYLFIPSGLYRAIALFVFAIVKVIQIAYSRDITKFLLFSLYVACAIALGVEYVWIFFI